MTMTTKEIWNAYYESVASARRAYVEAINSAKKARDDALKGGD